jgi:hypothetical protein
MLNNALCVFIKYSTDKIISATCSAGAALATFLPSDGPEVQKHLSNV